MILDQIKLLHHNDYMTTKNKNLCGKILLQNDGSCSQSV